MKDITNYLELKHIEMMLAAAKACSTRDYRILKTLWRTGIRASELLHIRLQDIEPPNNVINILKAKGDKTRRVYLDPSTLQALIEYAQHHNRPADQPVFQLTRQQVYNIVRRYGRMIGKEIHPHTLRHSFAINWVRQNQDLRRLQLLLGHSSLAVTQEYLQFRDADIMDAYDSVDFGSM
jgi:site-specific recombinase XerD